MALTREATIVQVDLRGIVTAAINSAQEERRKQQSKIEADFQKAIAEGTMSYDAQLEFRQKQIADLSSSGIPDPEMMSFLETSVGSIKKLKRFQTIRDKYTASLDEYVSGRASLGNHITLLEDTLNTEVDPDMREKISELLSQARQQQAQIEITAIQNRATVAQKDGSIKLIDESIREVTDRQAKAKALGNEDESTAWAETLVALKQTKTKINIDNAVNEISFQINRYALKPNQKLDLLNSEIGKSDGGTKITYNGVQYASEKAFWEDQRGQYIRDSYFAEVEKEINAETAKLAAQNKYGQIPLSRISAVQEYWDKTMNQDQFSPFRDVIEQKKVAMTQTMVNDLFSSIQEEFNSSEQTTSDVTRAERAVEQLESKFGIQVARLPFVAIKQEPSIAETISGQAGGVAGAGGTGLPKSNYKGSSIVDYLSSIGQSSSFSSRAALAAQKGISDYRGTSSQNLQLLDILRNETSQPEPAQQSREQQNNQKQDNKSTSSNNNKTPALPKAQPASQPQPSQPTYTPPKTTTAVTNTPASSQYKGSSIVDYLKLAGQDNSYNNRAKLAQQQGIQNYTGTAQQNTQLLKTLRGF